MKKAANSICRALYWRDEIDEQLRKDIEHSLDIRIVDCRESPEEVLIKIDAQLRTFGLEVVSYNTNGDFYAWHIEPLKTA